MDRPQEQGVCRGCCLGGRSASVSRRRRGGPEGGTQFEPGAEVKKLLGRGALTGLGPCRQLGGQMPSPRSSGLDSKELLGAPAC